MIAYRLRVRARLPRFRGNAAEGRLHRALGRLGAKLVLADLEESPVSWLKRSALWPVGATAVGALWMGPAGGVLGLAGGLAAPPLLLRRRCRRRAERMADTLPDALEALAGAVRAGLSLAQALREVAADASPPVRGALGATVSSLDVGASFTDALEAFVAAAGIEQARTVATAMAIGHRAGGDLPRVLETLAGAMRGRAKLEQQLRAGTAQARLSAWVVAGMPVAFLFLTGATSRAQADLLLRTPVGWTLLGVGAVLEAAGLAWMRRLARPR